MNDPPKMVHRSTEGNHADHIHPHCDCTFCVRFSKDTKIKGYNPEKLKTRIEECEGDTWKEKLNSLRRELYAEKKEGSRDDLPEIKNLPDELIHKSVGAKSKNYDIMDLDTGVIYHLVEGEYLHDKEVFAGKGVRKPYEKAYVYAQRYGGLPEEWMHVKGIGLLDTEDGYRKAEIHWSQHEKIGAVEHFIKEWLDEG